MSANNTAAAKASISADAKFMEEVRLQEVLEEMLIYCLQHRNSIDEKNIYQTIQKWAERRRDEERQLELQRKK